MSVRRRQNWLNSQRADVPHLRSVESAVSNDFDELLRGFVTGEDEEFVLRGFELNMPGAIGAAASGLQMLVAESCIFHGTSRESGTFFVVPSGTSPETLNSAINAKVSGAFTPNAVNYIGIEYARTVDDTTADTVYFWNPTSKNETSKNAPLARVLEYRIVITTSVWAANVVPIAKITADVAGNVVDVTDDRPMLFRLGRGGRGTPDPTYVYPWTNQTEGRTENPPTSTSGSINPFRGGDKQLYNLKEWMDSVMSQLKELKGTVYWYSPNVGGSLVKLRQDLGNTIITGRGNISHDAVTGGKLNWSQDIYIRLISSRLSYRLNANPATAHITLADNQAAYINLVRGVNVVPNLVFTNGSAIVVSAGAVSWTSLLVAGDYIKLASDDDSGYYQILSVDSLSQVTLTTNFTGTSTGPTGAIAQYAYGVYETAAVPSTDRHIKIENRESVPFSEDTFWLYLREDSGGATPRIYVRFLGIELQQGETEDISDTTSEETYTYIGSTGESDDSPIYETKLGALVAEQTQFTLPAGASITTGQYFNLYSANDESAYYVWFNVDAGGGNPLVLGKIGIEVAISSANTANQVASAVQAAINPLADFVATVLTNTVTVTNASIGPTTDATNFNVGGAFAISVLAQGSGYLNNYIVDGENLTLSIKKLDRAIEENIVSNEISYVECQTVVSGAPANDNEVTGPLLSGSIITIPLDSRNSNAVRTYTVGNGKLAVYLNGIELSLFQNGSGDYDEVGSSGTESNQIEILIDLEVTDNLDYRID